MFEYFGIAPAAESDVTTVNGWIMENTDKIPEVGDSFDYDRLHAVVVTVDGRRADKIKITINTPTEDGENV